MASGVFIVLYGEEDLELCLKNGIFGTLMPPVFEKQPGIHSKHYAVLADYACCSKNTYIFFFCKRN